MTLFQQRVRKVAEELLEKNGKVSIGEVCDKLKMSWSDFIFNLQPNTNIRYVSVPENEVAKKTAI